MDGKELFQAALGLLPPWRVEGCCFDEKASRLDIHLNFPRGSSFKCPVCQTAGKVHDTLEKTWRHLNFFQHETHLHARTPRVDCAQCGVHLVAVPWARPGSGFTLLFEALALVLVQSTLCVKLDESACVTRIRVQGGKGKPHHDDKRFYKPDPGSDRLYGDHRRGAGRLGRASGSTSRS